MKNFFLRTFSMCWLLVCTSVAAQDFVGFNSHPYAGVTAIDVNPANIAGTIYKADINIVGADVFANNNYLNFKPKAFFNWSTETDDSNETDVNGTLTNVFAHTRVQLPSAMYDINYNDAVGPYPASAQLCANRRN